MHRRSGKISLFLIFVLLLMAAAVMMVRRFGPYYWDYWKMKEVTKTAALHWKMFGRPAGEEKLVGLLEDKEISDYIEPGYCEFVDRGDEKNVYCSWEVDVYYPFSEEYRTLSFETDAISTVDGN